MNKTLAYIASAVGGKLSDAANGDRVINGFFSDSRTPHVDKLFLAIKGERADGNSYVKDLVSQGFAALTDRADNLSLNGDIILVDDVRNALQLLARHYRMNELNGLPVVGVTGSVGKTTTKDMISQALSCGFNVYKTLGNFNSQIGLPQTVLGIDKGFDCAVVELGMSYKGEMERISRCAIPDISVITNIGYSHIENLGSRLAIRDEKLKIAEFSNPGSVLLLNGDEPLLKNLEIADKSLYYVSVSDNTAHCFAENITVTEQGITFNASIFGTNVFVELNVKGKHFVINALFALATASLLGLDIQSAAKALSNYESDGKRQHIYQSNGHTVISDCYNASPESMEAALSVLSTYKGRRIAVLGDMLELGDQSRALHERVGKFASSAADVLITYGEMAKYIASASTVKEIYSYNEAQRQDLQEFLKGFVKEGDTVLYKASNGMNLSSLIV